MPTTEAVTPLELVRLACGYFSEKGIDTPRLDAEVLLAHVLGVERIGLYLQFDKPLEGDEVGRYREFVRRRAKGEPCAYLTGVREFWSLPFKVGPGVLIPRPDTELLVEEALKFTGDGLEVAEVGVGSGAVIVSLLSERPLWRGFGSDLSEAALAVSAANAAANGVADRLELFKGDLLAPFGGKLFDLIVANPPYIPSEEIAALSPEVRDHEPRLALDGGADGLEVVRRLAAGSLPRLKPGGALLLEFGLGQGDMVREIIEAAEGYSEVRLINDLTSRPRAALAVKG